MAKTNVTRAYEVLEDYKGGNPYIYALSSQYRRGGRVLSDFEVQYILKNKDYQPIEVNKTVSITKELGQKLFEKHNLEFVPEKIRISKIIGEIGETYHAYYKYRQSEDYRLAFLQKKGIMGQLITVEWKSLDIDFDKYEDDTKTFKLKEHQKEGVKFMVANKKCICADEMGCGKQQPVSTMIPTPDGFRRMGNLTIGDDVFASDGKVHKVRGIYPQGVQDVYEITFTDGSKTKCGLEHLWIVRDMGRNQKNGIVEWETLSLREMLKRGIIRSSRIDKYGWKNTNYRFRIPLTNPIEYKENEYVIHPYILGMVIGDGYLCGNTVTISIPKNEKETVNKISLYLQENYKLTGNFYPSCPQYTIVRKKIKGKFNLYKKEIERLGLNVKSHYKFIPEEYKFGSIEQRKQLLYGLMDSDGTITKTGNKISYTTMSKQLALDVIELVQSLGGMAALSIQDRNKSDKGINYIVRMQIGFCPFTLSHKVERYTIQPGQKKYLNKTIKSVEFAGRENCVCISVDSDDHSYLTNNYIVTHNTVESIVSALESGVEHVLVICPASLKTNWKKEILRFVGPEDIQIINGKKWMEEVPKFTIINYEIAQNFYEVAEEPVFETVEIKDADGHVIETMQKPVMVKKNGRLVQKMQKSRKKADISESLKKSPLFLSNFDCVIIDEAQKLSNKTSQRYKTIHDFLRKSSPKYIFLLTGTPLTNNPMNLYNILNLIGADITKDYRYYTKRFMDAKEHKKRDGGRYVTFGEPQNLEELRDKIKDCYIRRLTTDVGVMVEKRISRRYFDFTDKQREEYSRLWDDYVKAQEGYQVSLGDEYADFWSDYELEDELDKNRKLVEGSLIRQFFGREMVQHTIEVVDELLEDGEKVVIFTVFTREMEMLKEYYGDKAVCYRGGMTAKQKDAAQDAFNNSKNVQVFVGQIVAAGVGLSLPVSRYCVFNNFDWKFSDNVQAESRIHRLTQTRDVECIYMLFNDSISEEMFDKVLYKGYLSNELIKSEKNK